MKLWLNGVIIYTLKDKLALKDKITICHWAVKFKKKCMCIFISDKLKIIIRFKKMSLCKEWETTFNLKKQWNIKLTTETFS